MCFFCCTPCWVRHLLWTCGFVKFKWEKSSRKPKPELGTGKMSLSPIVVVHGGAWAIPDDLVDGSLSGVRRAAQKAWDVVVNGGSAVDAVEAAVVVLENDPVFDAGTGSVLTLDGTVEMDAIIMEGKQLRSGAVASIQNIKNPIQLARMVMDNTDHCLLVGQGANAFAKERGVEKVDVRELVTPEAEEALETFRKYRSTVKSLFSSRNEKFRDEYKEDVIPLYIQGHDTVGCVVRDSNGLLACGTSTGGITAKRPGRVGDSPLVGCGAYADNMTGAVSCTGHGESIMKICLAKRVADGCSTKDGNPQKSLDSALDYMRSRVNGAGGAICISREGQYGISFTTERMAWAALTLDGGLTSGINPEDLTI